MSRFTLEGPNWRWIDPRQEELFAAITKRAKQNKIPGQLVDALWLVSRSRDFDLMTAATWPLEAARLKIQRANRSLVVGQTTIILGEIYPTVVLFQRWSTSSADYRKERSAFVDLANRFLLQAHLPLIGHPLFREL